MSEWLRNKWFWFTLYHPRVAHVVYWLSLNHWRYVFVNWYFNHSQRYCWADLALWSLGRHRWRDMSAPKKCGYCYACMNKEEIVDDAKGR
jgi:hypothetical protein